MPQFNNNNDEQKLNEKGRMRRKNMMREKNEAKKTPKKITFAAVMFTMNNVKCVRFSVKHEYYSYFL